MTTNRLTRCRMLDRLGNACTAEAVDSTAEILLCVTHLAAAMRLIAERTRSRAA